MNHLAFSFEKNLFLPVPVASGAAANTRRLPGDRP